MNWVRRALVAIPVAMFVLTSNVAMSQDVSIATSNPGTTTYSSCTAIAKVANEKAGLRATVQPFASSTVFIPAVAGGAPQFGFASITDLLYAYEGIDYFAGRQYRDLRAVAVMYPLRNAIYVKKSSNLTKIADLKGKRMPDGYTSQKIIPSILDAMYATAGLSRSDMKPVLVPNVSGGADALISGKADGFFMAVGSAKVREADAAVGGLRAIKIEATPENQAIIAKRVPGLYLRPEKPGPENIGVLEPINVVSYDMLLFTAANVSDDVVYKLTKALYENKPDLVTSFPSYDLFEPQTMAKHLPFPYHPGAVKFYKEKGIWPGK
jgi:TRAP transporter TAXI family solute receptor